MHNPLLTPDVLKLGKSVLVPVRWLSSPSPLSLSGIIIYLSTPMSITDDVLNFVSTGTKSI